ncbi:hypothetical protein JW906_07380, partial [bacterium]|nr:hypothetical protein [bacterium]
GLLRYRRQRLFESIEWGLMNHSLSYRLNLSWMVQLRSNFLLGINRWKDMKTAEHEWVDACICDLSFAECVQFQPRDARSVIFGIGIQQGVYYVYSHGFTFEAGLFVRAGVQL